LSQRSKQGEGTVCTTWGVPAKMWEPKKRNGCNNTREFIDTGDNDCCVSGAQRRTGSGGHGKHLGEVPGEKKKKGRGERDRTLCNHTNKYHRGCLKKTRRARSGDFTNGDNPGGVVGVTRGLVGSPELGGFQNKNTLLKWKRGQISITLGEHLVQDCESKNKKLRARGKQKRGQSQITWKEVESRGLEC